MRKYIRLFKKDEDYLAFKATADFLLPNVSHCIQENDMHYNPWTWADEYLTFVALEDGTFTFTPQGDNVISYSTDNGKTWTEGNSVEVNNGDKVMWKGTMTPQSTNGVGTFDSTAEFDVKGNVMSLLYGDSYKGQTDLTGKNYAFRGLFLNNTKVVSAEKLSLSAMTLTDGCYYNMFRGCRNLTTVPVLPAMTLADGCYRYMFDGCTNLTTATELPATSLTSYCYSNMFSGCTNLTTAPELPATTLTMGCYEGMFENCTSLVNATELPATTLTSNCYQSMFKGCTNLTTAPELPATILTSFCYNSMFRDCTSLTTAPELPATTLVGSCYSYMFDGCSNLNYIKAMFTTTPSSTYTSNWVRGVASTGTFVKNAAATWNVTGTNGIPSSWTVVTE